MTTAELRQMQNLPLEIKVAKSKLRVREFVQQLGENGVYVSFSGGKDSVVLLDIVRSEYPNIEAVFGNTGCEFPEIVQFVKTFPNVSFITPKMNFKQIIEKYGYPVLSKMHACHLHELQGHPTEHQKALYIDGWNPRDKKYNGMSKIPKKWLDIFYYAKDAPKVSHKCCYVLKEAPMNKLKKAPFIATLACESLQRERNYLKTGCNTYIENGNRTASRPLSFWTDQDIFEYIITRKLKLCSLYGDIKQDNEGRFYTTGIRRTGCVGCGFGMHLEKSPNRYQQLAKTHPKLWNYYVNTLGFGDVFDKMGVPYKPDDELL